VYKNKSYFYFKDNKIIAIILGRNRGGYIIREAYNGSKAFK